MPSYAPGLLQTLNRAVAAYKAGRLIEAEQISHQLISAKHDFPEAIHILGVVQASLGKNDLALASYNRVLNLRPDNAEAHYNRGNVLGTLKRLDEALASYDRALALKPDYAEALSNRGAALHGLKQFDEALASYDRALVLRPTDAEAHYNRGTILSELQGLDEALASYDRAIALKPNYAEAFSNRGVTLHGLERFGEALASYDRALVLRPADAEAHYNRGNTLTKLKRFDEGLASYDRALALRPDYVKALSNRGAALRELQRFDEALASYDRALALRSDDADVLSNRGVTLFELERFDEALVSYDRALTLKPDSADALSNRGNVLAALGREQEALASYRRALVVEPTHAEAYNNMGNTLAVMGLLGDAEAAFVKALELDPKSTSAYINLGKHRTFTAKDPYLIAMRALDREQGLPSTNRIDLHFALGKAYGDLKDHRRAFEHLLQGNALKRTQINYDEAAVLGQLARIQTVFTRDLVMAKAGLGDCSRLPIFIVGMPRSGTTLIEQILSSHRHVLGGGELRLLSDIVRTEGSNAPYPDFATSAGGPVLKAIGATYVAKLQQLGQHFKHVTDKMPQNYLLAGLIRLALPNARIIHVVRDPIDTCISCFSTLFVSGYNYTYDLAELGRYYRHYQALMAHWRNILPEASLLEVRYEDVVDDLEKEARRIFTHCGLDWDPHCLKFHQIDRPVRTASVAQVRRPIYKSAVGRWRGYEPYLGRLLAELNPGSVSHV